MFMVAFMILWHLFLLCKPPQVVLWEGGREILKMNKSCSGPPLQTTLQTQNAYIVQLSPICHHSKWFCWTKRGEGRRQNKHKYKPVEVRSSSPWLLTSSLDTGHSLFRSRSVGTLLCGLQLKPCSYLFILPSQTPSPLPRSRTTTTKKIIKSWYLLKG